MKDEKLKILIVDDEEAILSSLQFLLRKEYDVTTVTSAEEALEMIERGDTTHHLVLSDQRMKGMQGHDLLKKVNEINPDVVSILITGYSDMNSLVKAVNEGHIFAYISKPWNTDELKLLISRASEHYRVRAKNMQLTQELKEINQSLETQVEERTHELSKKKQQLEEDLDIAKQFQNSILPQFPEVSFLQFDHRYIPYAGGVSGDVYDVSVNGDGDVNVFLGDATGHGVAAAFMTMMVQIGLDSIPGDLSVDKTMQHLNDLLTVREKGEKFVTGIYLRVSPAGVLHSCNAGHPAAVIIFQDDAEAVLDTRGLPLGLFSHRTYEQDTFELHPGAKVYVYTDGVTEWVNADDKLFGKKRLLEVLKEHRHKTVGETIDNLMESLNQWSGGLPCSDDLTILGFQYTGQADYSALV
ncbi:MAG: SpoIIE family protein phosphatase [SAR324 cluster bacterium]|nr:SpoIIE family protein phosphatase [SAR324 cluster bacterium]